MRIEKTEQEIINAFKKGKVIRMARGMWSEPDRNGTIVQSVDQLTELYRWAVIVEVYKSETAGIDYDLIGVGLDDMWC